MPPQHDPKFEKPKHPGEFLYNLVIDTFGDPGVFYERIAAVEEREIQAGRREISDRQTAGRDYWRGIFRAIVRGDRGLGPTTGPLFAKAFRMPLKDFALAVGLDKDSIERPPRVARKDLEAELAELLTRVKKLESQMETVSPALERLAGDNPEQLPLHLHIDRDAAEALARHWEKHQPPPPMSEADSGSGSGRRKRAS